MGYIFVDKERLECAKQLVQSDVRVRYELKELAEKYMNTDLLSVTFHKSPAVSGNPHDYFSEGTYWWPDEKNPGGPYIRRDGEVNPNVFVHHLNDIKTLCDAVCILCQAGLFLDDKKYYKKAVDFIRVWFLDEQTKMNPHLEYSQAIRGICDGRGIGIIDTTCFVKLIYGADILDKTGFFEQEIAELDDEEKKESDRYQQKHPLYKTYKSISGWLTLGIYLAVSFATGAWYITWLIFPISACIDGVIKAILDLQEVHKP